MAVYTATQAATLLESATTGTPSLSNRIQVALLKHAETQIAGPGNSPSYVRRIATNPAGEANAVIPILLSMMNVDDASQPPTDAELASGIADIWPFLTS